VPPLEGSVLHLLLRSTGFGEGAASGRGVTCRVLSTVGFFDAGLARRCGGESHARADALVSPDARWAHAGVARCGTVPSPCASPELAYEAGHSWVRRTLPRRRRERSVRTAECVTEAGDAEYAARARAADTPRRPGAARRRSALGTFARNDGRELPVAVEALQGTLRGRACAASGGQRPEEVVANR